MIIPVIGAVGRGPTELSAFDAALCRAEIANRNLVYLSSVVPPGSKIVQDIDGVGLPATPGEWGDRLYCVIAQARTSHVDREVWAGIGWVQAADGSGLFVEHAAGTRYDLERMIEMSLSALCRNRNMPPPADFPGEVGNRIVGATCTGLPVCVLAVAVFDAEPWRS